MGHTTIRPFQGLKNGKEDPDDFIEDIEWAYEQDYKSNSPAGMEEKQKYEDKTKRILFRQHMAAKAYDWYTDLGAESKSSWAELTKGLKAAFPLTIKDAQTRKFKLRVKLSNLEQAEGEPIADYLDRCEELSMRLPTDNLDVGMATLRGIRDTFKRERISFECNKDSDYSYDQVKRLIKAAYIEIRKTSPFDPQFKLDSMRVTIPGQPPMSAASQSMATEEMLKQALYNTSAAFPALLQGLRSLNSNITKGITVKTSNAVTGPSGPAQPRDMSQVQCHECGEMGHYKSAHFPGGYQPRNRPYPPQQQQSQYPSSQPQQGTQPPVPSQQQAIAAKTILPRPQPPHFQATVEEEGSDNKVAQGLYTPARCALTTDFNPAIAANPPKKKGILAREAGIKKARKDLGKQSRGLPQHILDQIAAHEANSKTAEEIEADDDDEVIEMDVEEDKENEDPDSSDIPNRGRHVSWNENADVPQTRVSKTGKVQELVEAKKPKLPDPIRGMVGRNRFDMRKILDTTVDITLGELLDRSDTTIKEMAHYMTRSTPRYRVKKPTKAKQPATQSQTQRSDAIMLSAAVLPPPITAYAYDDDGKSTPLMITAWVGDNRFTKALLDGGSLVELISRKKLNKIIPPPVVHNDGHIRVSLANDTLDTLTRYAKLPINVQGVEALIKAWVVDVEVYDILLGLGWMRRVHCNPHFGKGRVTISGDDQIEREVPAQLAPMEVPLPIVELDDDDELTADQACERLLDEQENL